MRVVCGIEGICMLPDFVLGWEDLAKEKEKLKMYET